MDNNNNERIEELQEMKSEFILNESVFEDENPSWGEVAESNSKAELLWNETAEGKELLSLETKGRCEMQFIDISEVKNYDKVMDIEDLQEYFAQKAQDLKMRIEESPDDKDIQSMKEELESLKEFLDDLDVNTQYIIHEDYFEDFFKEEINEVFNVADFLKDYINYQKIAEFEIINRNYSSIKLFDEEYLYKTY